MHVLPPEKTVGTPASVGAAIALALSGKKPVVAPVGESTGYAPAAPVVESDSLSPRTLGDLRAQLQAPPRTPPRAQALGEDDGTPVEAWNPSARAASLSPRIQRQKPAPQPSQVSEAAHGAFPAVSAPPAAQSMSSVLSHILRINR